MLERFQEEHPSFDFSGADFNGQVPDARDFMGGAANPSRSSATFAPALAPAPEPVPTAAAPAAKSVQPERPSKNSEGMDDDEGEQHSAQ
ncbi:hypothetical protein B484DRAFT_394350 [Ochromonadaceae sp. CCMP2298]|nr:hypothetical protein B484DRAFT_394350 [Ochromonadaceae sp. CCMP2298]